MTDPNENQALSADIVDLEEHAATGAPLPECSGYRIRVNDSRFVVHKVVLTGLEVLELAGLSPPEDYCLELLLRGHKKRWLSRGTQVDLTAPGTERFVVHERCAIPIKLNEHEIVAQGPQATGLTVKEAGAKAGLIELDFVLSLELPGGKSRIIGDHDSLHLAPGDCFTAVAPDDNS